MSWNIQKPGDYINGPLTVAGAATLASATITGDLTVDTSTLKVDSALNKVGIGVATLTGLSTLNVAGDIAITSDLVLKNSGGTAQGYIFGSSGINYRVIAGQPHVWQEGGSDLMRLNSTGLGVGKSPAYKLDVLRSGDGITAGFAGATYGIRFDCGGGFSSTGSTIFGVDPTLTGTYQPLGISGSLLTFGISGVEKARLDASGNLLVGTTTNTPSARLYINQSSGSNPGIYIAGGASTTPLINFSGAGRFRSDGSYLVMETTNASGTIYITANTNGVYLSPGGTSWTANSDERLKDIIEPISNAVSKVGSLRSVIGKFKTDNEGTRRTFLIAQDVQKVLPEAVDASNPDRLGVGYSEVIPLLVAAIKELTARVEALEA